MPGSELVYVCEICQTLLEEHHCKAICPNCGRMFDCSDLPLMRANAQFIDGHFIPRPGSNPLDVVPNMVDGPEPESLSEDEGKVANLP